ncbi:MAG: phosphoribosylanthranilate isomerase, partial [Desulfurivibrionaceae bacterium]
LGPDNVGEAIGAARPYGVDVNSGVEKSPGRKDHAMLTALVEAVRLADLQTS